MAAEITTAHADAMLKALRALQVREVVGDSNLAAWAADKIEMQQAELVLADRVIYRLELGGEPWSAELLEARDAAINRVRALDGKGPI